MSLELTDEEDQELYDGEDFCLNCGRPEKVCRCGEADEKENDPF